MRRARGTLATNSVRTHDVWERTGADADALVRTSRLIAKIDSAAVQDGYQLYLHAFFVTSEGKWCVVQQGMNQGLREARRYHWKSEDLAGFFDSPHSAIEGRTGGTIVNLADARAARSRAATVGLIQAGPDLIVSVLGRYADRDRHGSTSLQRCLKLAPDAEGPPLPHLQMPHHHEVRVQQVLLPRLHATLASAAQRGPVDFAELLLTPGVGARTVAALAFVAEIVHGAPCRFKDPARYSLALGGKDGHPFPVPLKVYDDTIRILKRAVSQAKLGRGDVLAALRQLDTQARALEGHVSGPRFEDFVALERHLAPTYGGRAVSKEGH